MQKDKETVRLELTPEQKQLIKKQTGKDAEAVELSVSELEERIAPIMYQYATRGTGTERAGGDIPRPFGFLGRSCRDCGPSRRAAP